MSKSIQDESSRNAVNELKNIRKKLQEKSGGIQIRGFALTAEDKARVAALDKAVVLIAQAIESLEAGSS